MNPERPGYYSVDVLRRKMIKHVGHGAVRQEEQKNSVILDHYSDVMWVDLITFGQS